MSFEQFFSYILAEQVLILPIYNLPTIKHTRGEHANRYTTAEVVYHWCRFISFKQSNSYPANCL